MTPPTPRIVCFGEILIRLSAPGAELLLQSLRLDVAIGGAEANVAVALARLGGRAAVVSVLPDNALGRAARDELRRHGVDTSAVRFVPGRMGLYFLSPGAALRPAEVTYDRAGSAFADAPADAVDWTDALHGADWLHVSGVTPAVGPRAADAAMRAVVEARRLGVKVSFDGNYRAKLWEVWQGDGPSVIRTLLEHADIAFADDRDFGLVLGERFAGSAEERRRAAADAAFAAFPNLRSIASTVRLQRSVTDHELSASLFTRNGEVRAEAFHMTEVTGRIGGGDAFAAGVLHGLTSGMDDERSLRFGLAAACLKHSIPGDFNLVGTAEVEALLSGEGGLDVRR